MNAARLIVKSTLMFSGFVPLTLASGCGTVIAHLDANKDSAAGIYSGVRLDGHLIANVNMPNPDFPPVPWIIPFSLFDLPLSAAADTMVLPYDIYDVFRHKPKTPSNLNGAVNPNQPSDAALKSPAAAF